MRTKFLWLCLLLSWNTSALAALDVLACEPQWAALTLALGGEHVNVRSATTALQDPHQIQARPSLIAQARKADLLVCSGAGLEAGWLPPLLRKSANNGIQPGASGYFMATDAVELLEKPDSIDRSQGHVHAAGNPHVELDPHNMLAIASALTERLIELQPSAEADFSAAEQRFSNQMHDFLQDPHWQRKMQALAGKRYVAYHPNWTYLAAWLGMECVGTLEPKPGIPPTSGHISKLVKQLQQQPVAMILYATYQNDRAARSLGNRTATPVIGLPFSVQDWQQPNALIQRYQQLLEDLTDTTG